MSAAAPEKKEEETSMGLDDDPDYIQIKCKSGHVFDVPREFCMISKLIKTSLERDDDGTQVEIASVTERAMVEIVKYITHHKGVDPPLVEKPLSSKRMRDVVKDPWDADFIDRLSPNRELLYDVILSANFMDVKSLLHLGCAKVAALIKGVPLDRIKDTLEGKYVTKAPVALSAKEEKVSE